MNLTTQIKEFCKSKGADLVGIADLEPFKNSNFIVVPKDLLEPFSHAISIAICLDREIIKTISDAPTPAYANLYRSVNISLDKISSEIVQWINERGFNALAIAASKILDEVNLLGAISHKAVARMAGIGWQGKNLLIITPQYGSRIRLATVLTNMPLISDHPLKNRCGKCDKCAEACPSSAIKNVSTDGHYLTREDAVDIYKCYSRLKKFKVTSGIEATICGVCIKACPFSNKSE